MTKAFGLALKKMFIDNKRIFIRFIVSLTVCVALIGVLCSVTAFATDNNAAGNAGATHLPLRQAVRSRPALR